MSTEATGPLVFDRSAYAPLGAAFRDRFLEQIIGCLLEAKAISSNDEISEEDIDTVFNVAFKLFAAIEDVGGLRLNGGRYPVVLAFAEFDENASPATRPDKAPRFLATDDRGLLHAVEDQVIKDAYRRVLHDWTETSS